MRKGEVREDEVSEMIDRCFRRSKPPVELYVKNSDGSYNAISEGTVVDVDLATKELKYDIVSYLRTKELEIDSRMTQVKCEAYELALTRSRQLERIEEEEE